MERNEILWRQYQQNIELYKFYMELVVKFNVFYYAVTGAILSFFFANPDIPKLKYSLVLPLVMSIAFAALSVYGAILTRDLREETFNVRDKLKLDVAPDVGVLSKVLYMFAGVFAITALGCGYLLCAY